MSLLWRYLKRFGLLVLIAVTGLIAPVGYVETMCRGDGEPQPYAALVDARHYRAETSTLMTYPEWHIVHAYDDYARVIATGDPHDFGYLGAISGFWSSLCGLSEAASSHGEIDSDAKLMVYVIGVSFTAELLLKAGYEETLGRLFAALRGPDRAALDDLSSAQAAAYANFLQQVPWYKWRFREDAADLDANGGDSWRDRERRFALGLEYRAKAAYAGVIADAVAATGTDALTLRMVLTGVSPDYLAAIPEVRVITQRPEGLEIETPRYRALTHLLARFAADGADFVEIAGNDDIMFTALSDNPVETGALRSLPRQGATDYRHLIVVKVSDLAAQLRKQTGLALRLEHIHDY